MEIFVSVNNRESVIQIPVIPPEFIVESPFGVETYSTIRQGDISLIGLRGLKTITWNSFFPARAYPFIARGAAPYSAWDYVNILEGYRDRRVPVRLVITGGPDINIAALIPEFEYSEQDGSGDVYYNITFTEFKFIQIGAV